MNIIIKSKSVPGKSIKFAPCNTKKVLNGIFKRLPDNATVKSHGNIACYKYLVVNTNSSGIKRHMLFVKLRDAREYNKTFNI